MVVQNVAIACLPLFLCVNINLVAKKDCLYSSSAQDTEIYVLPGDRLYTGGFTLHRRTLYWLTSGLSGHDEDRQEHR